MKSNSAPVFAQLKVDQKSPEPRAAYSRLIWLGGVLGLALILILWVMDRRQSSPAPGDPSPDATTVEAPIITNNTPADDPATETPAPPKTRRFPKKESEKNIVTSNESQPSAYTRQLMGSLVRLADPNSPITPERAAEWRKNFQALLDQGAASVPAIREFLDKNSNVSLSPGADQSLGFASVRSAMINALGQIGGPEATEAAVQTLRTVADPKELANLAQVLDRIAPEQYKEDAVLAARQMLASFNPSSDNTSQDIAAAFAVLQRYGGESAIADLEQASSKWGYYSAIAMAQLPDGTGIPSLVKMLQPQNGSVSDARDPALRMLAQVSTQYPEAQSALLNEARQNRIPLSSWLALAPILAGEQMGFLDSGFSGTSPAPGTPDLRTTHLAYGNQNFYNLPVSQSLNSDQIKGRMELIQQLLPSATDPSVQQALRSSYDQLNQRLSQSQPSGQ